MTHSTINVLDHDQREPGIFEFVKNTLRFDHHGNPALHPKRLVTENASYEIKDDIVFVVDRKNPTPFEEKFDLVIDVVTAFSHRDQYYFDVNVKGD